MNAYEIKKILRKQFPTLMAEHYIAVGRYLEKISTVEDKTALELATRYLINLKTKKKKDDKI